jgi:hypothetical protein
MQRSNGREGAGRSQNRFGRRAQFDGMERVVFLFPMKTRSRYLIVLKDGDTGAYTADELLAGDLTSADVGLTDIIRLDDLTRFENGQWVSVPEGIAETPDLGEDGKGQPEHFHPSYL